MQIAQLRKRLADVVSIDLFNAIGRETAEGLVRSLEARLNEDDAVLDEATIDNAAPFATLRDEKR